MTAAAASVRAPRRHLLLRRLRAHRLAMVGLVASTVVVLTAVLAPWLAPFGPGEIAAPGALQPPSAEHWLGSDELGRDVLSRVIWGGRASLQASVLATGLALLLAVPIGLTAGYYRGPWDYAVMRATDTILAFPFLVLAVGLAAILGPSLANAAIAIGVSQVPQLIRVTRGEVLSLREEDFVLAAVADGAGSATIMARHLLPNVMNTLIVQATVIVPFAIITESILSFLGLGVQPPTPSWGVMLTAAQAYSAAAPWLAVFPGIAIFVATLSFNLLGDGLRDVLDPKAHGRR